MQQSNPANTVTKVVGIAGGTALIAPIAPPILHGIAGIAVIGLGLFAAGSLVMKATQSIKEIGNQMQPKETKKRSV
jgi:hypothetical protein